MEYKYYCDRDNWAKIMGPYNYRYGSYVTIYDDCYLIETNERKYMLINKESYTTHSNICTRDIIKIYIDIDALSKDLENYNLVDFTNKDTILKDLRIRQLEERIKELEEKVAHLMYKPGGEGYEEARKDFEKNREKKI